MNFINRIINQLFSFVFLLLFINTITFADYTYDANGNLINDDIYVYIYNDANRVKEVRIGTKRGKVVAKYFYNHTGRRIKKIEYGKTCYYVNKHFQSCDGKETRFYFINDERIAAFHSDGSKEFYANDHIGSPMVVSDAYGNVVERISYDPYGEATSSLQYGFSGKEKDSTGNHYFEARYLSSRLGSFISTDPIIPEISDSFTLNPYQYANNNPLRYTDKTGEVVDMFADAFFIFFDIGTIIGGYVIPNRKHHITNGTAALVGDSAGLLIPGVTGLGAGKRLIKSELVSVGADGVSGFVENISKQKLEGKNINFQESTQAGVINMVSGVASSKSMDNNKARKQFNTNASNGQWKNATKKMINNVGVPMVLEEVINKVYNQSLSQPIP